MGMMEDARILALFAARDEAALTEFDKKYKRLCLQLARDITGDEQAAEECLNDLYLRLWNSIPPAEVHSLSGYACRIMRNLALQRLESAQTQKRAAVIVELDESVAGVPDAESGEITARIEAFLQTRCERDAMIFVRRYFYSESLSDIAARLGMRQGQVAKLLHRMRRELRVFLSEGGIML